MDLVTELIQEQKWEEALDAFLRFSEHNALDENAYILGATIMEHYGKYDSMFNFITEGLKIDPNNYELYLLLGNYYGTQNTGQAYLSYENALYHCKIAGNNEDIQSIGELIEDYKNEAPIQVRNVSFIILSCNTLGYTKLCIDSIRQTCDNSYCEIIVVENGSKDGSLEWLKEQPDIKLISNKENKGFPAGCNQGIDAACSDNDIFLLNNDTIMLPNSLFWLRIGLYADKKNGASGAVSNYVSNHQAVESSFNTLEEYIKFGTDLNIPSQNPYELKAYLVMFAMLIRREALDNVGRLDERFTPGNFEDNDYGMRLLKNGYNCILCHNSYIFHFGSKSFGNDVRRYEEIYYTNRDKFKEKWGFYDDYYTHARNDVIKMIDSPAPNKNISVLEIGCGLGETLAKIKYDYPNANVHGIEIVEKIASLGSKRLDIKCGNIETCELDGKYDYILFPDVLEHLRDPEAVLRSMTDHLRDDGYIIASIPNIMNAAIIRNLLAGYFTYEDEGILDRTHLRFFTLNEIKHMFDNAGYTIINLDTVVVEDASTSCDKEFFDKLLTIDGVARRELFDIYQFIVKAVPKQPVS